MNRLILLIILSLTINSYAQNDKIIYQHILHPNILNNEETLNLAVSIIGEEAKLNPELIYFRVHFLNEIYGNKNISNETNGKKELDIARRKYIYERNSWLDKQLDHLNKNYNDVSRVNAVISFFEDLKADTKSNTQYLYIEVDQNLMDFYVVFYFSKGSINKFDDSISYAKLKHKYEKSIINHIQSLSNLVKTEFDRDGSELYKEIENNIPVLIDKDIIDYAQILLKAENNAYSINHINSFGIGINYFDVVKKKILRLIY